jgi:hypothetical protein
MLRKAFNRHKVPNEAGAVEPDGRPDQSREEGRARFFESMILLSSVTVLAMAIGLAVGVPLALMLGDLCRRMAC